ncbi:carboxymuconolactone decarboxylase family protein [Chloroflexota bacterium]
MSSTVDLPPEAMHNVGYSFAEMSSTDWSEKTANLIRQYRGEETLEKRLPEPHGTLLEVSPDFGKMTDEYLLGAVMARPGLSMRERSIIIMAALLANRYELVAPGHMRWTLNIGVSREEVIEIILQVAPIAGWPVGNEIFSLIERAYPGYQQTVKDNPFSDVWSQPGLSLRERTMVTMAAFVARRFNDRLKAHIRHALNIGLSREEILELIMQVTPFSGWAIGTEAIRAAGDVFSAKE